MSTSLPLPSQPGPLEPCTPVAFVDTTPTKFCQPYIHHTVPSSFDQTTLLDTLTLIFAPIKIDNVPRFQQAVPECYNGMVEMSCALAVPKCENGTVIRPCADACDDHYGKCTQLLSQFGGAEGARSAALLISDCRQLLNSTSGVCQSESVYWGGAGGNATAKTGGNGTTPSAAADGRIASASGNIVWTLVAASLFLLLA